MPDRSHARLVGPAVLAALLAVVAAVVWQVRQGQRLPNEPVPIAWQKEACAHCHMHVSESRFAVQVQTTRGDVLNFDDPGCFFQYVEHEHPEIHEVWLHHSREERWLRLAEAGFVAQEATPMDFGLGVVGRDEAGAMTYAEARERALAKSHR